jgi:hypothetical protein
VLARYAVDGGISWLYPHYDEAGNCVIYKDQDVSVRIPISSEELYGSYSVYLDKFCDPRCIKNEYWEGVVYKIEKIEHCTKNLGPYYVQAFYDEQVCNYFKMIDKCDVIRTSAPSSKSLSGGAIAGIVIGCIAGIALIACGVWFVIRYFKNKDQEENVEA